jgi:hypothetical protein
MEQLYRGLFGLSEVAARRDGTTTQAVAKMITQIVAMRRRRLVNSTSLRD